MKEYFKKLLADYWCATEDEVIPIDEFSDNAYVYRIQDSSYMVCSQEGAKDIIDIYRNASIDAAKKDIPEIYHEFFNFKLFSQYCWQSLEDIYGTVYEAQVENKVYYICLL